MQKKIEVLAITFLIFLLGISFLPAKIYAVTENLAASASSKPDQSIDYELPYPGLLPDNPLYILRIIRDKTVSFLVSVPLKKAEFNLLQADKRLNAGVYLFNKNKILLALSTISKAENYFEKALDKIKEARKQGVDIENIRNKLINSSKKHQEVINSLKEKSPENFKANFNTQQKRAAEFQKEINSLTLKR